jgi:hypothetical protein
MNKTYAGIGSRETPSDIMKKMSELASFLEAKGWMLFSGGAHGADKSFADGVKKREHKKIFLPWKGFNAVDTIFDEPSELAEQIAERYHPNWRALGSGGRKLQARNSHILLDENCRSPVQFVLCWTKNGAVTGGTGQGLRIALDKKIPIFNLALEDAIPRLNKFLAWFEETHVENRNNV